MGRSSEIYRTPFAFAHRAIPKPLSETIQFWALADSKHYDIDIHFPPNIYDSVLYQLDKTFATCTGSRLSRSAPIESRREVFPARIMVRRTTFSTSSRKLKALEVSRRLRSSTPAISFQFSRIGGKLSNSNMGLEGRSPSCSCQKPHLPAVISETNTFKVYIPDRLSSWIIVCTRSLQLVQAHFAPGSYPDQSKQASM